MHTHLSSVIQSSQLNKQSWWALAVTPVTGSREGPVGSSPKVSCHTRGVSLIYLSLPRASALLCERCCPLPFTLCQRLPRLSVPAQPAALLQRAGAPGHGSPQPPSDWLLWAHPTSCREVPLIHRSLRVCPQGGGHDLRTSQTAQKINIKTRTTGGSVHRAEWEGRKWVKTCVCQGEQQQKVFLMKNVLSMWFVSPCCSPQHRAAVQLSLAPAFDEEAWASSSSSGSCGLAADAGEDAVTLQSPRPGLSFGGVLPEGWWWGLSLDPVRQEQR